MRLKAATLRNYRMHRELTISFDPSRTVIGGPNEAGKSTIVEAIHRVLFLRHSSTVDLDDIRPRQETATPSVTLEFERHGQSYELHKAFKGGQGSVARLVNRTTGEQLAGDEAEERLRELLGVDEVHATKFKGQWSYLWVRQGSAATDPTTADVMTDSAERLRLRLSAASGTTVAESALDTSTYERIVAVHAATYGSKNTVLKTSDLARARAEVEAARQAATAAAEVLFILGAAADTLAREEATIGACQGTLTEAAAALRETESTLARIESTEQALVHQRRDAAAAAEAYAGFSAGDTEIRQIEQAITELQTAIAPRQAARDQSLIRERRCQDADAHAVAALTRAAEEQREAAAERDGFDALDRIARLSARRTQLEIAIRRVTDHEAAATRLDDQLRDLPPVDRHQLDEILSLDRQLHVARSTLQAIATRIEVLCTGTATTLAGESLTAGAERTLTEAVELVVGEGTAIRITPGGGQTLADVRLSIADLEDRLRTALAACGAPSAAAARTACETRVKIASLLEQLTATVTDLRGEELRAELRQTVEALEAAEAEIARALPSDRQRPADAAALAMACDQARRRHAASGQAVQLAQERCVTARAALDAAATERRQVEAAMADSLGELQRLAGSRAALLALYGDDRETRLADLAIAKRRAEDAVTESARVLAGLRPDEVRADRDRLIRTVTVSKQQIAAAQVRQAEARGRLESGGTVDLHEAKAAADARLVVAELRRGEIERRSGAIDLLRSLFENRRQAMAERLAAPLRDKVAEYLDALYGDGNHVAVALTGKGLADLRVARPVAGGLPFPFAALSGGTKEQVAAACRLAMAELLAGDDACLPVVFDDAFTHSDPGRIRALQRVLDLGARRGLQIIVFSCNPDDYGMLGARRVDLPAARPDAAPGTMPCSPPHGSP